MQWLARVCVRRPVFTWVLSLSLLVVGGASFFGLGVDRFPRIDFPMIVVTTVLPGASPAQIETDVIEPIEESVGSIAGLDELTSTSFEGFGLVVARFSLETDLGDASENVRDRVGRVVSSLPAGTQQPRIERMDPDAAPVMLVAVVSQRSGVEVTDFANRVLKGKLESLPGVGGVLVQGGTDREIHILLDPERMAALGVAPRDVERAIASQNLEVPGGFVSRGARTLQLRVTGRLQDVADFEDIPVAERDERVIRIRDIADVSDGAEEPESLATINGHGVVLLAIRKQSGANTVAVIDALSERIEEIKAELPGGYELQIVRDESEFIRNAISAVEEHLFFGGLLAALVVLLFLRNGRSTVIAALAIPTSIVATFALIRAMGLTLNTITLLGLTLSVGIVIDDAIVVLENIVRFIEEKGYSPRRAAVIATQEIGLAVLATSLSLVAVFLPIAFMSGIIGRFMSSFGFTMAFSILVSLFVSFTLTPMLCSRWLKGPIGGVAEPEDEPEENWDADRPDPAPEPRVEERATYLAWFRGERSAADLKEAHGHGEAGGAIYAWVERSYLRMLAFSMRNRWVVGLLLFASMASVPLLMKYVPKNFLPSEDESRLEVTIRMAEGTSLAQTQLLSERIAAAIRAEEEVTTTVLTVGAPAGDVTGRGPNQASIYVQLVPAAEREESQEEFVLRLRTDVLPGVKPEGAEVLVDNISAFGGSGQQNAPIQYIVSGPDMETLSRYTQEILARIRRVDGVGDASTSLIMGRPAYEVKVDRARAADLGVTVVDLASTLRTSIGGGVTTTYEENGEQYDVRLRAPLEDRSRPETILQTRIPASLGPPGRTVRLADVATIEEVVGPAAIHHYGRRRQATIFINTRPGASEQAIAIELDRIAEEVVTESGYQRTPSGRSREMGRAFQSFMVAVLLSFIFMYLVLAAQFESWIHPVTILSSLPLTLPFAVLSALIMKQSLNLYSTLGILVLFGVVKKNAILQVDHTRSLMRGGLGRADAVMLGNRDRLRPILMTTLAFVAGMLPLLVSKGAGAGTNRSIGAVVAGGQTLSLLLTLIATPVIFSWLDDLRMHPWVSAFGRAMLWPFGAFDRMVTKKSKG